MSANEQLAAAIRRLAREEPARYLGVMFFWHAGWWSLLASAFAAAGVIAWSTPVVWFLGVFGFAGLMTVWKLAEARRGT